MYGNLYLFARYVCSVFGWYDGKILTYVTDNDDLQIKNTDHTSSAIFMVISSNLPQLNSRKCDIIAIVIELQLCKRWCQRNENAI